jgi:hypothetical protein
VGAKIPVETVEGLLVNILNQAKEIQQTTLIMLSDAIRESNAAALAEIKASNERLSLEIAASNERLVTELRNLLFPRTGIPMERSVVTEEAEDALHAFEQGRISKDELESIMGSIEVYQDDLD